MNRTDYSHDDLDGGGAIVWALIVVCLVIAIVFLLAAPSHGSNVFANLSLRQRAERVGEWQIAGGGEYASGPWKASGEAQHEREANPPGEGSTIYTDIEGQASYRNDIAGAGVRWTRVEEYDLRFAEAYVEILFHGPTGVTVGLGIQQRFDVDWSHPVGAMRGSYTHTPDWGEHVKPKLSAVAAYGGGLWTTEANEELAFPIYRGLSFVQTATWERWQGRTRAQGKMGLRIDW